MFLKAASVFADLLAFYYFLGGRFMKEKASLFKAGLKDGFPIGLGYLPLAFTLGMNSTTGGFSLIPSLLMSALSFTGVGQMTTMDLMSKHSTYFGLFIALLVINLRNIVLSLSLAQRINPKVGFFKRAIMAMGNTDEIFALTIRHKGEIPANYFLGVMTLPYAAWILGALVGSIASTLIPPDICIAMKMALYAMLVASVVPACKESKPILYTAVLSGVISCVLQWIPAIKETLKASGIVVIGSLVSAVIIALLFPVENKTEEEQPNE